MVFLLGEWALILLVTDASEAKIEVFWLTAFAFAHQWTSRVAAYSYISLSLPFLKLLPTYHSSESGFIFLRNKFLVGNSQVHVDHMHVGRTDLAKNTVCNHYDASAQYTMESVNSKILKTFFKSSTLHFIKVAAYTFCCLLT